MNFFFVCFFFVCDFYVIFSSNVESKLFFFSICFSLLHKTPINYYINFVSLKGKELY